MGCRKLTYEYKNEGLRKSGTLLKKRVDYYPFGLTFNQQTRENTQPQNYLYNGKELQTDLDLNWTDYGARMYDASIGRWHSTDGKAEFYFANSPYNYALNTPTNAIDPDGNLVIFINGLGGGGKNYWKNNVTHTIGYNYDDYSVGSPIKTTEFVEFDVAVSRQLGDNHRMYFDGSPFSRLAQNLSARNRYIAGLSEGIGSAEAIIESLSKDAQGNITESIKIITHSMGAVYGKGFVRALLLYIRNSDDPRIRKVKISLVADFDPYQAGSKYGSANESIHTMQFINSGWWNIFGAGWLANETEEGAESVKNNKNKTSHFISTFIDNVNEISEGTYSWDKDKQEWICTTCN